MISLIRSFCNDEELKLVNGNALALLYILDEKSNLHKIASLSMIDLGNLTGMAPQSINRKIKELESLGLLLVERNSRTSMNVYQLRVREWILEREGMPPDTTDPLRRLAGYRR